MQNRINIHASSEENDTIKVDVTKLQYFTTILNQGFDDALQEHIFAVVVQEILTLMFLSLSIARF